jgi:peptidoglycan/LPS O-acetylase OafA/YrhL
MTANPSSGTVRNDMARNKVNLDLMRSFAILLVLLDHILLAQKITAVGRWQPAWIGVVGVYIFFVHTCLVLMWSLERKPHTVDFYIRRAFRIYPLVLVALTATVLLHAPIGGTPTSYFSYARPSGFTFLINSLLMQNVLPTNSTIMGVLWSLPLEVDMYVLLPLLFFFVRKNFSLWPLLLFWGMAAALVRPYLENGNHFLTVIPCFLPGVMAYVLFRRSRPRLPAWLFPVFLIVLATLFMLRPSVVASWPMCLALGLGIPFFHQLRFAPIARASHEIAKYSYGMYLGHPFAIVLGFYLLAGRPLWMQLSVTLLAIAAISVAAYHLLERPMINLGAKLAAKAEERYEQKHLDAFL